MRRRERIRGIKMARVNRRCNFFFFITIGTISVIPRKKNLKRIRRPRSIKKIKSIRKINQKQTRKER